MSTEAAVNSSSQVQAVGRRKTAVARVRIAPGQGRFVINDKAADVYLGRRGLQLEATAPLRVTETERTFDISVKVEGGGLAGQAGAISHGLARALILWDPNLRAVVKSQGLLTRDARMKERKKPGLKRARKAPQYTKR